MIIILLVMVVNLLHVKSSLNNQFRVLMVYFFFETADGYHFNYEKFLKNKRSHINNSTDAKDCSSYDEEDHIKQSSINVQSK